MLSFIASCGNVDICRSLSTYLCFQSQNGFSVGNNNVSFKIAWGPNSRVRSSELFLDCQVGNSRYRLSCLGMHVHYFAVWEALGRFIAPYTTFLVNLSAPSSANCRYCHTLNPVFPWYNFKNNVISRTSHLYDNGSKLHSMSQTLYSMRNMLGLSAFLVI